MGEALAQLGGKPCWWSPRIWPTPARSLANLEPSTKTDVDVEQRDRELLADSDGEAGAFVEAVKWDKNALRWTGVHAMSAALQLTKMMHPQAEWELVDYKQAS